MSLALPTYSTSGPDVVAGRQKAYTPGTVGR
jgi:hypothetical protein